MGIWIGSRTRPRVPTGPCGSAYLAGQSASFSGTNYLERATEAGISPASLPLILAGWVYLPTSSGFQTLVTKGEMSSGNYEWLIYHHAASLGVSVSLKTNAGSWSMSTGAPLSTAAWHHVYVLWKALGSELWVDGTQLATNSSVGGTMSPNNTYPLRLGAAADGGSPAPNGLRLDAWGMWGTGVTVTAASLYNSGSGKAYANLTSGDKTGLIAYYNLDEVDGSATWCDWSGNGYHLTNVSSVVTAAGKV